MIAFDKYLPMVIEQGRREAQRDGSSTVEAHHLLLAIAAGDEPTTRAMLGSVGLDYPAIRSALDREFAHSLAAVGVSVATVDLPRPARTADLATHLGASVKVAIGRGLAPAARKKDLRPAHLLLGIVQAQVGTVPRALALAGVDRADLVERLRQSLAPTARG